MKVVEDLEQLMSEGENYLVAISYMKGTGASRYALCNREALQDKLTKYYARTYERMSVVKINTTFPFFAPLSRLTLRRIHKEGK